MGINMGTKSYNNTLETPDVTLKEQLNHNRQMGINMGTKSYNNTLETPETTLKEQLFIIDKWVLIWELKVIITL